MIHRKLLCRNSWLKLSLITTLALIVSLSLPFASVSQAQTTGNDVERIEEALEGNFEIYEDGAYTFNREQALENGLTEIEADLIEENFGETSGDISTQALPVLAVPAAVKSVAKAAAVGGAAAVGVAFMTDVYKTSAYTACQNFYGEVGAIDNFCEANDYVD
ncbi:hypothetical protein [Geomicrobium sp. JCM 19038]|uniref:hypothetical protein n=1 Tax=Geomicrobium sp. JCM 19038 TaxID=1460635 RepID=UPI00045F119B|nr:hypothetical protein [Geomicrobium sp. JCM 19038]GAK07996.1 hypothetical protein JCM19038_1758 [Geomicrobium sp. JCM 19038]